MDMHKIAGWLSPDVTRVARRFPLAVLFALAATLVALTQANSVFHLDEETALRLFGGVATGFVLALAGALFAESRPELRRTGAVLAYLVPLAALPVYLFGTESWVVLPLLSIAALMWLSVSAATQLGRGVDRRDMENRFWWLNQRAAISGSIALLAGAVFFLGLLAIDRSLDLLFGIEIWNLMAQWVLPIVLCLFLPVYWLAALPRLEDFDAEVKGASDFLNHAIGFVGQFVLTPLLAIYALILLAYAGQIAITRTLPVGVLSWLVMAFVITGAANWLVLHPSFARARPMARFFRVTWFWATLLPLFLFALGLFVRIDAYGLTPERLLLVAGGIWAALLTLSYLGGRGDIRLMPALAGLAFLLLALGPFNIVALPLNDQAQRFEAALAEAQAEGGPGWTKDLAGKARGALDYLDRFEAGMSRLAPILERRGYDPDLATKSTSAIAEAIALPEAERDDAAVSMTLSRPPSAPVSVAETPIFLGEVTALTGDYPSELAGMTFGVVGTALRVAPADQPDAAVDVPLADWLARQGDEADLSEPQIDFVIDGRAFRLVVGTVQLNPRISGGPERIEYLTGYLFSDRPE